MARNSVFAPLNWAALDWSKYFLLVDTISTTYMELHSPVVFNIEGLQELENRGQEANELPDSRNARR